MFSSLSYSSSITICLVVIALLIASHEKHSDTPFYSLIAICCTTAAYQWFSWQFTQSSSISEAVEHSRHQSTAILFTTPCVYYCFARWTRVKNYQIWLYPQLAFCFALLIINLFSDFGLKFATLEQTHTEHIYNAFSIEHFKGTRSVYSYGLIFYGLCISVWIASKIGYFIKNQQKIYAFALTCFILAIFITVGWSLIYNSNTTNVNLVGFPLTFLMLALGINIAHKVKIQNQQLYQQQKEQKAIEEAMTALAQGVSSSEQVNFYHKTLLNIHQLFKTKYAFIGIYKLHNNEAYIETIAAIKDGQFIDNFTYALADTPCNDVCGKQLCQYESKVAERYPKDEMLLEMGVESYIGLPLFNGEKEALGIIVLLDEQQYRLPKALIKILNVFGSRIGSELSRDKLANRMTHMAYYDHTTQLPNRAKLYEEIERQYNRCATLSHNATLMLIDIDRFKDVNRIHGYDVAEEILKEIGNRLNNYAHEDIFVARNYGGEFAVLISNIQGDYVPLTQQHWQQVSKLIKSPILINNKEIKLDCTAGAVTFPRQVNDQASIIRCAESALMQAKQAGRNQCALFDQQQQSAFDRKQELQVLLREALDKDEGLFLVYQPQTDQNGQLIGAEALLRWIHPEQGFISPAEFIPIVEETELIHLVGQWVARQVLRQINEWQTLEQRVPPHISINVAAKQLTHLQFTKDLVNACKEFEVSPSQIVLELTESGLLSDIEHAISILKQLQSYGFKIALDDFGTGYSSLSYLKKLPINILKIDKSFVEDISVLSTKQLMQSIFAIAKHLNFEIIAEGTETQAQVTELLNIGCAHFQGYYFSKPLEPEQFIAWEYIPNK